MLRIGEKQRLTVVREASFGVYLGEKPEQGQMDRISGKKENVGVKPGKDKAEVVLLPKKEVDSGTKIGDEIEVFLYRDSNDRPIATRREPLLTLHHFAVLKVKEVTKIGAFLDWGLEKDLLLPYHEQTTRVYPGDECVVALYLDKSRRLCATMKVYNYLSRHSPYRVDDQVRGRVYEISDNFGAFVAVDDKYSGLIPKREGLGELRVGNIVRARVTGVKEDGKLDLSIREKAYLQMDEDAEYVLETIREFEGVLPFDDKASPETIQREFGLSKSAFKRAVGRLMKQGKVENANGHIRIIKQDNSHS